MKTSSISRPAWALAALALAAACSDGPAAPRVSPDPVPAHLTAEYRCTVDVEAASTSCEPISTGGPDRPLLDLIAGAPYVSIGSSGTSSSRGNAANEDTTSLNATVTNNTGQPLGTTNGVTAHTNGTRMLFSSGPTVTAVNSGTVAGSTIRVDNPDGTATFTNAEGTLTYTNKPFYQYNGVLVTGATTGSKLVRFVYSSNVKTFSYGLRISSPVQYEYGWVTISPASVPVMATGATTTLSATVYNAVSVVLSDGLTWASSDPGVATINSSTGQVTAVHEGTTTITATSTVSTNRTGTRVITVDEAPAVTGTSPGDTGPIFLSDPIVVEFTELVNVSSSSFTLECPTGSSQAFTVSGSGTNTITLDPVSNLPVGTTCTVTVIGAQVSDSDALDGPDHMASNYVFSLDVVSFP